MSSRTIWKYELPMAETTTVFAMPKGARILSVAEQGGQPFLWAMVNPNAEETTERIIRVAYTGTPHHPVVEDDRFIGTVLCLGGALVLHVFQEYPEEEETEP